MERYSEREAREHKTEEISGCTQTYPGWFVFVTNPPSRTFIPNIDALLFLTSDSIWF